MDHISEYRNAPTIAITNPYKWPLVRRGSERLLNDLSHYLNDRGYGVEVYAMASESNSWNEEGIHYHTLKQRFSSSIRQYGDCHYFAFKLQKLLKQSEAQVIHCLNYFDAYAAIKARRRYRLNYKVIFHVVGIPTAKYFRSVPLDAYFMHTVLRYSDAVFAVSRFARQKLLEYFHCQASILPPPVVVKPLHFKQGIKTHDSRTAPIVLFVGDLLEPRKGAMTLSKAFTEIKKVYPKAQLYFTGNVNQAFKDKLLAGPEICKIEDSIKFFGVGKVEELNEVYELATVTVLPSVWEALGLVLVESLAAGTPVVGTNHAGISDIINHPDIGRMFAVQEFDQFTINWQGLAQSILEAIDLTLKKDVRLICNQRAMDFSWDRLGPEYERWYAKLITLH